MNDDEIAVFCTFVDYDSRSIRMETSASLALREFEKLGPPIEDDLDHPANAETDAQRALLRYMIRHRVSMALHNDHWDCTLGVFLNLLEEGKAFFLLGDGVRLSRERVVKIFWSEDDKNFGGPEGWTYSNAQTGETLLRINTGEVFRDP